MPLSGSETSPSQHLGTLSALASPRALLEDRVSQLPTFLALFANRVLGSPALKRTRCIDHCEQFLEIQRRCQDKANFEKAVLRPGATNTLLLTAVPHRRRTQRNRQ